jgi:hypothetical protein
MQKKNFAFCRPDLKNGLVWCQHFNGSWAPPFQMTDKEVKEEVKEIASPEDDTISKKI